MADPNAEPIDAPVLEPAQDLLGMSKNAERLAKRVAREPLPFTLGIYGAWGEGKTTFAHLVKHFLQARPDWSSLEFVEFSAWPYVTADGIWRALLETIARKVYKKPVEQEAASSADCSVATRARKLLLAPVYPDSGARGETDDSDTEAFEQLMAKLGRATALTSRASRDAETAKQISLLAGLVLDVASTAVSPLGVVRGWLTKGQEAVGAHKAPKSEVATVEEMRQAVQDLFKKASEPRTVVLIDDLDRCLPQVAFDVLETLKVFLSESAKVEAKCLFIVAVDQHLLSQGLAARLGTGGATPSADARRYLEKVIQLGVGVGAMRESTPERLIAGRFPEWIGAADLIDLATRGNLRRLNQQCDLLALGFDHVEEPS